jgi:hypothetical protein
MGATSQIRGLREICRGPAFHLYDFGANVNQALGAVVSEEHLTCAAMHRTVPQVIFNGSQSK